MYVYCIPDRLNYSALFNRAQITLKETNMLGFLVV
jgi:hypothetical protein